jgi:hypothetical protein
MTAKPTLAGSGCHAIQPPQTLILSRNFAGVGTFVGVATKTPNAAKSLEFLGLTAIGFSAYFSMCVPSSPFLPADSVAEPFWN